jgi:hypothetical protein
VTGISAREKHEFNVDNEYTDRFINGINTILLGTIDAIANNKATISITNKYMKLMKDGTYKYVSFGKITTNFATLSLFKYVPKPGDTVIVLVFQSDVQGALNQTSVEYPSRFNLYDSIVIPLSLFYAETTKVEIGDPTLDMDLDAKNLTAATQGFTIDTNTFNLTAESTSISTDTFSVVNRLTSDNLLVLLAAVLQAIGLVPVGSQTIDQITGNLVSSTATKLTAFS